VQWHIPAIPTYIRCWVLEVHRSRPVQVKSFARSHLYWKKLVIVVYAYKKCIIGGSSSRLAWAKCRTQISKITRAWFKW
jgi:hypothetical protein